MEAVALFGGPWGCEDGAAEAVEDFVEAEHEGEGVTTAAFHRRGTILALGTDRGAALLVDADTRSVAARLEAEGGPVRHVSWSRSGAQILAVDEAGVATLWDVLKQTPVVSRKLPFPPDNCVLRPSRDGPRICAASAEGKGVHLFGLDDQRLNLLLPALPKKSPYAKAEAPTCFAWTPRGHRLVCGTDKGSVVAYALGETWTPGAPSAALDVPPGSCASVHVHGTKAVASFADRTLRVFALGDDHAAPPVPVAVLRGGPDREGLAWRHVVFDHDGARVAAAAAWVPTTPPGAAAAVGGTLFMWDVETQAVDRVLELPKGCMTLGLACHPHAPLLCHVASTPPAAAATAAADATTSDAAAPDAAQAPPALPPSVAYLWAPIQRENWSAFAPGLRELEANEEYDERESEFDELDEDGKVPEGNLVMHPGGRRESVSVASFEARASLVNAPLASPPPRPRLALVPLGRAYFGDSDGDSDVDHLPVVVSSLPPPSAFAPASSAPPAKKPKPASR